MIENVQVAALVLSGSSHGLIEKQIQAAIAVGKPFRYAVIREALAIESRSFGARAAVIRTLRLEMRRQESEQQRGQAA